MSYLDKALYEGETIQHRGRFHWLWHVQPWVAAILPVIVFIGGHLLVAPDAATANLLVNLAAGTLAIFGIITIIRDVIDLTTIDFGITDRRIISKTGFFSAEVKQIALDAIEAGKIEQSFWGRLFNFGKLIVTGRGDSQIAFPTMKDPKTFMAEIERARAAHEEQPMDYLVDQLEDAAPPRPVQTTQAVSAETRF